MRVQDGVAYPEGPITLAEAVRVRLDGETALASGCDVIDLAGITQVDSSALSVLLAWRRDALNSNRQVVLRNPPANILSLIDLYGVGELIPS
ncbi:MAG: STAS domain-containing protein [Hydrogenophilales bacterium]|nr:STAS domain-containing protein [Hydrogenophilales bacterium]